MRDELKDAIERHALSDAENEVCGFLYSDRYIPLKTASSGPLHFQVDPYELARVIAAYGEPLAIFHTHPKGGLEPSTEDLASTYYTNSIMIIGKIENDRLYYRAFKIRKSDRSYDVVTLLTELA